MARKKRKNRLLKSLETTFWLGFSIAGGVLFGFGIKDFYDAQTIVNGLKIGSGLALMFIGIHTRNFRTETSVAMKRK